jgi:extracellular matrix regulatory protein A
MWNKGVKMDYSLLNVGFGSTIVAEEVIAILAPNSAPMRRLKDEAKEEQRLIDATHGRRTRSIVITKTNHIVLSSIQSETLSQRFMTLKEKESLKTAVPA